MVIVEIMISCQNRVFNFCMNFCVSCFCWLILNLSFPFLSRSVHLAAVQTVGIEHTSTIRMDTMNAVVLSTGRGITTQTITGTVPFLPLESGPALQLAPLVGLLTPQKLILSLESAIPSLCLVLHDGILTAMTGGDALIELTIIAGVDLLIPRNHGTLLHKGPRDRPPKPPIPPKELPSLQAEAHVPVPEVDRPARIRSAAPVALEVAGWWMLTHCLLSQNRITSLLGLYRSVSSG